MGGYSTNANTKILSNSGYCVPVGGYDVNAASFFTVAGITSVSQKQAVNTMVNSLKSGGLWTKFLALYPIVGGTATSHSYNLINTSQYQITWVNSPTQSSNGVDFDGATQYGKLGLAPSVALTTNSTALHYYSRENVAFTSVDIGVMNSTTQRIQLILSTTGGLLLSDQYGTSNGRLSIAVADTRGMFTASRTSSSNHFVSRNGSSIGSNSTSEGTMPSYELYIGAQNNADSPTLFASRQCAFAAVSSGMSTTEAASFYTIVQAYQTSLGRQV